ncbi:MAG: SGNH/GDSL hydrolase family protein [Planctomycetota bacterium]|jgi:lysophospholipase L1-like esterase
MQGMRRVLDLVVGGVGLALVVWPVRLRRRIAGPAGRGPAFGRTLVSLGFFVLYYVALLEVSVRVVRLCQGRPMGPSWHYVDDGYLFAYHPFRAMELRPGAVVEHGTAGYRSQRGESYVINAYGCRGPALADRESGKRRIVCLGGSSTLGPEIAEGDTWPAQLAALAPDWSVMNAGVMGYTSQHILAFVQGRLLDLEPDLLVCYLGRNDLHHNESVQGDRFRPDYAHSHGIRRPPRGLHKWLVRHSWVWLTLTRWRQDVPSALGRVMRRRGPPVETFGPRGLEAFRRNVEDLLALAARRGVQVLLVSEAPGYLPLTLPDGRRNPHLSHLARDAPGIPPDVYTKGLEAYAAELRRTGAPFLDLARELPRDPALFLDSVHLSAKGGTEVARRVLTRARALLEGPR